MQLTIRAFLALYLAHLLTDFVFQSSQLVQQKKNGHALAYFKHGAIHYFCSVLAAGLFLPGMILSLRFQVVVIALTLVHLSIDICKIQFAKSRPVADGAIAFVVDQSTSSRLCWQHAGSSERRWRTSRKQACRRFADRATESCFFS